MGIKEEMRSLVDTLIDSFGLRMKPSFLKDGLFYFLVISAFVLVVSYRSFVDGGSILIGPTVPVALAFSLVIWQPLIEELFFRGFLQGQIRKSRRISGGIWIISYANIITSLLFCSAHLINSTPFYAAGTLFPSLLFGILRDRHGNICPSFLLHSFLNLLSLIVV